MTEHKRPMREDARVAVVSVTKLRAHPRNVRLDLGDLRELAESIRFEGVLVPLMAERRGDHLRILHGHRRWAAAQLAGVGKVPVVIVPEHSDDEAMFLMLAEDKKLSLTKDDRKRAVLSLRNEFHKTWPEIAERLGYSVQTVRTWAACPEDGPVAIESPKRAERRPIRASAPKFGPAAIHSLLARFDSGELVPTDVVEWLREQLGDWEPRVRPERAA